VASGMLAVSEIPKTSVNVEPSPVAADAPHLLGNKNGYRKGTGTIFAQWTRHG